VLLIAFVAFVFSGCKKDDSSIYQYPHMWSGTYTGTGDHGTWLVTVELTGEVSGHAFSDVFYEIYELTGTINSNGELYATFGTTSLGGSFTGQMSGDTMSGTWVNDYLGMSGTWTGSKEI
jgi:hypothetical protein